METPYRHGRDGTETQCTHNGDSTEWRYSTDTVESRDITEAQCTHIKDTTETRYEQVDNQQRLNKIQYTQNGVTTELRHGTDPVETKETQ